MELTFWYQSFFNSNLHALQLLLVKRNLTKTLFVESYVMKKVPLSLFQYSIHFTYSFSNIFYIFQFISFIIFSFSAAKSLAILRHACSFSAFISSICLSLFTISVSNLNFILCYKVLIFSLSDSISIFFSKSYYEIYTFTILLVLSADSNPLIIFFNSSFYSSRTASSTLCFSACFANSYSWILSKYFFYSSFVDSSFRLQSSLSRLIYSTYLEIRD